MKLIYLIFIFQGSLMIIDEYLHHKREMPRWERWGHPLDTLTVLLPFTFLLYMPFSEGALSFYVFLAIFSCLFITKDEWVHARLISPLEHWLHSLLFMLHPLMFLGAGILWWRSEIYPLIVISSVIFIFLLYQIFRWSFVWKSEVR